MNMSETLLLLLEKKITEQGPISFADYMDCVLYHPQLGYYQNHYEKIGQMGDFITAPEISPLFSHCLAKQCLEIFPLLDTACILELGAGNGLMASDILSFLEPLQILQHYFIYEPSESLQKQQKNLIAERCPHSLNKVSWLTDLPQNEWQGIVLANEVFDAMPIHLFQLQEETWYEKKVIMHDHQLAWHVEEISPLPQLTQLKNRYFANANDYTVELNLQLKPYLKQLFSALNKGVLLFIDYGFSAREYYHPDRTMGTLMCHYQHRAHPDPFYMPGLQDITTHVNFTEIAEIAAAAGLHVAGFTHQASFLMSLGLLTLNPSNDFFINQKIKQLIQPHEMGELFKVIALNKNLDLTLQGFQLLDLRRYL